jgi:arylsulfatase A-like enzyme
VTRCCVAVALVTLGIVGAAAGAAPKEIARQLASRDEAERFEAAMSLLRDPGARRPKVVRSILADKEIQQRLAGSVEARAAADFVLARLEPPKANAEPRSGRGIILISIDTLRADHLGCYGYSVGTSPTIDALAKKGVVFTNAMSTSSWTLPAHMSMLTSLYPSFHKLEKGGGTGSARLDDAEPTLAGVLHSAGFATAGLVAHPYLSAQWGFDRGFDIYRRYSTRAAEQTERALLWLDWHRFHVEHGLEGPDFFLFLHYIDPHEPYDAPGGWSKRFFPDYRGTLRPADKLVTEFSDKPFSSPDDLRYALALYDGEIGYVDSELGRLSKKLVDLGIADSTLVILTSDHGEEFKEHGSMGHKQTLYEEVVRVPLVMAYAGKIDVGQKVDVPVSLVDLLPTILDYAGEKPLASAQGVSLRRFVKAAGEASGSTEPVERTIFAELGPLGAKWEFDSHQKTARSEALKLIFTYDSPRGARRELYDLKDDPGERKDAYAARKREPAVHGLEREMNAFVRSSRTHRPGAARRNRIDIDPATRERLKALGYEQ